MLRERILIFGALIVLASATLVNHCDSDTPLEDANQVTISNCDEPVCLLKQGTTVLIKINLVPNKDIQSLKNNVQGIIGIPISFVGVDGTNACDNIYNADGSKAGCPLKKGEQYIYKNSFPILSIYPRVLLIVRYALREENDDVVFCFKVPVKITE